MLVPRSTTQQKEAHKPCSIFYIIPNFSTKELGEFLPLLIRLRKFVKNVYRCKVENRKFTWNYTNYMQTKNICSYKMFQ